MTITRNDLKLINGQLNNINVVINDLWKLAEALRLVGNMSLGDQIGEAVARISQNVDSIREEIR